MDGDLKEDLNPLGITGLRPIRNGNSMVTNSDGTAVRASVIHAATPVLQLHEDLLPENLDDVEFMMEEDVTEVLVDDADDWSCLNAGTIANDQLQTANVGRSSAPPQGSASSVHPGLRRMTASATSGESGIAVPPDVLTPRVRGTTVSATSSAASTAVAPSLPTPRAGVAAAIESPRTRPEVRPRSLNFDDRVADRLARGSVRTGSRPVGSDSTASEKVNEAILKFYEQEKIGRRKVGYWINMEGNLLEQCNCVADSPLL